MPLKTSKQRERNKHETQARSIKHILSFSIRTLRESSLLATGLHRTNRLLSYYHGIVFNPLSFSSIFLLFPLSLPFSFIVVESRSRPLYFSSLFRRMLRASSREANLSVLAVVSTFYFHPIGRGPLRSLRWKP